MTSDQAIEKEIIDESGIDSELYTKAAQYWNKVNATVDGMLGGFSSLSDIDIKTSENFLSQFYVPRSELNKLPEKKSQKLKERQIRCLDCASGIGRITKNLLLKYFDKVDLLDNCQNFLKEAQSYIGHDLFNERVSTICSGLHTFKPKEDVFYDLIWLQWCSGYLSDKDFVEFFKKCKKILKPHGFLILKDNHTSSDENDLDTEDGSVTRSYMQIIKLIEKSGYKLIDERRQYKFPKNIYPVKMFCLKPIEHSKN